MISQQINNNLKYTKAIWLSEYLYFQKVWTFDISVACWMGQGFQSDHWHYLLKGGLFNRVKLKGHIKFVSNRLIYGFEDYNSQLYS